MNDTERYESQKKRDRAFVLGTFAVAAVVLVGGVLLASAPTAVALGLVALTTAYGAHRGALSTGALLVGLLLAAVLGMPVGLALEDTVGGALGLTGLAKRGASVGISALVILVVVSAAGSFAASRLVKRAGWWAPYDKPAGAALGLVEGVFLGLIVLWGALAIRPVAESRLASRETRLEADRAAGAAEDSPMNSSERLASRVLAFTDAIDTSAVGPLATATNPMADAEVFTLADDYLDVMRDPVAREHFMQSDAIRRFRDHPAVAEATETLRRDPEVRAVLERGLDREGLRTILESDVVLEALDGTDLEAELGTLTGDLREALEEARGMIRD